MPENVRMSLCTMPNASIDALAAAADRMIETGNATVFTDETKLPYSSSTTESHFFKARLKALEDKIDSVFSRLPEERFSKALPRVQSKPTRFSSPHGGQSRYMTSNQQNQACYYHQKFGRRAYRCTPPCNWSTDFAQENWKHPRH